MTIGAYIEIRKLVVKSKCSVDALTNSIQSLWARSRGMVGAVREQVGGGGVKQVASVQQRRGPVRHNAA